MGGEGEERIRLIMNSSILISYLVRRSYTRRLIHDIMDRLELVVPDYALLEVTEFINRNRKKLQVRGVSPEALEVALYILAGRLIIVPRHIYIDMVPEAHRIASEFDEKDTPFIALALKLNIPIWTRDKELILHALKTRKYIALDTKAVEDLLAGKSLKEALESLEERTRVEHGA